MWQEVYSRGVLEGVGQVIVNTLFFCLIHNELKHSFNCCETVTLVTTTSLFVPACDICQNTGLLRQGSRPEDLP